VLAKESMIKLLVLQTQTVCIFLSGS